MKFEKRLVEATEFAVRNMGGLLLVHGASSGFENYTREPLERYHMAVCVLMGNAIPNISSTISDPKEAMYYMLLHIVHINNKIVETKSMQKMFSEIKFESDDLLKPSETSMNALKWYLKFQYDPNVKKCVETGMELFFYISREMEIAEPQPGAPKLDSIIERGDKLTLTFQKLIDTKNIKMPTLTKEQLKKIVLQGF